MRLYDLADGPKKDPTWVQCLKDSVREFFKLVVGLARGVYTSEIKGAPSL